MNDQADEVIPISQLFYDDGGPHIIQPGSGGARYTPARGQELHDLIGATIAQLGAVAGGTRKTPTQLPPPVPIESLLYKGRAALDRALEIRAAREIGELLGPEIIDELLDLVALAAEE